MSKRKTGIQWTGRTWNPMVGCSLASPGCTNCYAMRVTARLEAIGQDKYRNLVSFAKGRPVWNGVVRLAGEGDLVKPLAWTRPALVFVNSMSDLFHEALPDEQIDRVFAVMALSPEHRYQILTKRHERMRAYVGAAGRYEAIYNAMANVGRAAGLGSHPFRQRLVNGMPWPLRNVALGVSVEDQERACLRIPSLLDTAAELRFVSYEPALGPVAFVAGWMQCPTCRGRGWYLKQFADSHATPCPRCDRAARGLGLNIASSQFAKPGPRLDWIIVGGESGPRSRPFDLAWAEAVIDATRGTATKAFVKQLGANPVWRGEPYALSNPKGGDMKEWPEHLRVREDMPL